ncbi:MAG TPA: HD domain-containing protein [Planctomycetota bacterium]|nr:HD domain-containing protein [Planctomycetota bacterium]
MDPLVLAITTDIRDAGGRALVVGGYVRDRLLGRDSKDLDIEVYGLRLDDLERILGKHGEVIRIGRSFGVLRIKSLDVDFSIPRRDSKVGRGHRGFVVDLDPSLTFEEAARRRDLTINSIALDPLTGEIIDPHGGRRDLQRKVLRATDPSHFAEDPLRGLRVAQFAARFDMDPDEELRGLCALLDLSELPGERLFEEFKKLFLKGRHPARGLEFLRETGLLRFFPELEALVGVPQDPQWHPEGTVWEHTLLVVDEAALDRTGDDERDLIICFAALCHDLGKPATTYTDENGRVRSPEHEEAGIEPTRSFLGRLRAPNELIEAVVALVRWHLAPVHFVVNRAKPKAYRRLARKLWEAGVTPRELYRVARADHFGRTTPDALAREFPTGEEFIARFEELGDEAEVVRDVVLGRHLIARGFTPGPHFGEILSRCREVQDETGWDDPDRILDTVLSKGDAIESPTD